MLTALRKMPQPTGAAQLGAVLHAFGSPEAGPLSRAEDAIMGLLWSEGAGASLPEGVPRPHAALARLGRFLLDHRSGGMPALGVQAANTLVHVANRVRFGPGGGFDHATLGMAAVAAALEPARLQDAGAGRLARWFALQAVAEHGLEHLVPAGLAQGLCGFERAEPPAAARWLWDASPAGETHLPPGRRDRAAAIDWMLGPERHALDYLRPLLADREPRLTAPEALHDEVHAQALASGEMVDFGIEGNSDVYCLKGTWHAPEPTIRWGFSPSAMLTFCPVVPPGARLLLVVTFSMPRDLILRQVCNLTITVSRRTVWRDQWDAAALDRVTLDLGTAPPRGTLLPVAFQLWPALRPSMFGWPDTRELGAVISQLRLVAW